MNTQRASLPPSAVLASASNPAISLESGIPIAKKRSGGGRNALYPFAQLAVGDSFFVAGDSKRLVSRLSRCASSHKQIHGGDFVTRSVDGGARVWRTEAATAKEST